MLEYVLEEGVPIRVPKERARLGVGQLEAEDLVGDLGDLLVRTELPRRGGLRLLLGSEIEHAGLEAFALVALGLAVGEERLYELRPRVGREVFRGRAFEVVVPGGAQH